MPDSSHFEAVLRRVIGTSRLDEIAKETGFCRRRRLLDGAHTLWVFVVGLAGGTGPRTIAAFVRLFTAVSGKRIAYKAFHDRVSQPAFPRFMQRVLEEAIPQLSPPILRPTDKIFGRFEDILAHDGSSFALPDALQRDYPGRFTTLKPAAVEVHVSYSALSGQATGVTIAPDKEAERQFLPNPEELRNKLMLIDAGYVSNMVFSDIDACGGFFICRVGNSFNPKILRAHRNCLKKKNVGKKLREIKLERRNYDFVVESRGANSRKHEWRVVVFYSSEKKKHLFLVTNLNARDFRVNRIAEAYRLRWQIELFFKECKSYTGLKAHTTKCPHVVEGLIWATMISVLLRRFLSTSAFRRQRKLPAFLTAASMSWMFFKDLARAALDSGRSLRRALDEVLELLRITAGRASNRRVDSFEALNLDVDYGYR